MRELTDYIHDFQRTSWNCMIEEIAEGLCVSEGAAEVFVEKTLGKQFFQQEKFLISQSFKENKITSQSFRLVRWQDIAEHFNITGNDYPALLETSKRLISLIREKINSPELKNAKGTEICKRIGI